MIPYSLATSPSPDVTHGMGGAVVLIGLYFIPGIVAGLRHHHNQLAIFMLNLFLGWTLFGWVIALVWACTRSKKDA